MLIFTNFTVVSKKGELLPSPLLEYDNEQLWYFKLNKTMEMCQEEIFTRPDP